MARILIVDDDLTTRLTLEEMLHYLGYEVVGAAESGHQAVDMARDLDPDLIIMDIVMPGDIDGISAAEIIKEECDSAIVFISGFPDPEYIERAKHVQPFGYVMKPFDEIEVKGFVEIALHKREMELQLKAVHEQLRESRNKYKQLLNHAPAGVYEVDFIQQRFVHVNDAMCKYMEYTREEFLSMSPFDILSDESKVVFGSRLQSLLGGEEVPPQIELKVRSKSGRDFWVLLNSNFIYEDKIVKGAHVVVHDVTERRLAQDQLERTKDRLESLWKLSQMGDAEIESICSHALAEVEKMTQSQYAFYGFMSRDTEIMTLYAWSEASLSDCDIKNKPVHFPVGEAGIWGDAVKSRRSIIVNDYEADLPGKKGFPSGHVPLKRIMVVPVVNKDKVLSVAAVANKEDAYSEEDEKQVSAFLKNVQSLIDRKKAEDEKKVLEDQLEKVRRMEALSTLTGGIAHDYNNLLAIIFGNLSLAMEKVDPGTDQAHYIEAVSEAALKIKDLTHELMSLSRGGAPIKNRGSVKELVKSVATQGLTDTGISLKASISEDLWDVLHDSRKLKVVFRNVIQNAVEAMPGGGNCVIQAENLRIEDGDSVPSLSMIPGAYVHILIRDEGKGIAEKDLERIFDPYFSTKPTGVQKGMGLGLATARAIVKKHGGEIIVASTLDAGTTVHIYLPAQPEVDSDKEMDGEMRTASSAIAEKHSSVPGILLMEDEEMLGKIAQQMLERLGYEAEIVKDGVEAIQSYKERMNVSKPFDALILDLTIKGGMGGEQTLRELLKIDPEVKAIVSSGYFNDPVMADFRDYGFKFALEKPYKMKDLKEAIENVLH